MFNGILAAIPVCCGLLLVWQGSIAFWRAPNRFRLWMWLTRLCLTVGMLAFLYTPLIEQWFLRAFTMSFHLLMHQIMNLCVLLALYFTNAFLDDIMDGPASASARWHHRLWTTFLVGILLGMVLFFVRAIMDGEEETASWLYAVPWHNPNLMVVSLLALTAIVMFLIRIARFSLRFGRITPLRSFKTANLCFAIACDLAIGVCGLALVGVMTPAASLLGYFIVAAVMLLIGMSMVIIVFAARLADRPGRRLLAIGSGMWDVVSILRMQPLWSLLTDAVPEASPPVRPLGWWFILRHISAFRDSVSSRSSTSSTVLKYRSGAALQTRSIGERTSSSFLMVTITVRLPRNKCVQSNNMR